MSLTLKLFDSFTEEVLVAWGPVLEADTQATIFSTPDWLRAWWETLGSGDLLLAVVFDDTDPVAVFPSCTCSSEGTLTLMGGHDVTDQQVPIAKPGYEHESLATFLDWAFSDMSLKSLEFHSVAARTRWAQVVSETAQSKGFRSESEAVDVSPVIELPATFDEYLASLRGHDRHEMRRKRRRLSETGLVEVRKAHEVGWEEDLAAFFDFHKAAPTEKKEFFTPEIERFFRRLAADLFLDQTARLDVLDLDGVPVAATFSYDFRGRFELYNSSFNPELFKLAPGMVLISALIEKAIEEGKVAFDFLRGDEAYKMRFGPKRVEVSKVRVFA